MPLSGANQLPRRQPQPALRDDVLLDLGGAAADRIHDGVTVRALEAPADRRALLTGAWLLALVAIASIAVLVGGRMADQIRRVGLLKAVGGTPGLVAAVLLAEYVLVALLAAATGLVIGRLSAPWLTEASAGSVPRTRSSGSRPPRTICIACAMNSISRMPPSPILTLASASRRAPCSRIWRCTSRRPSYAS